MISLSQLYLIVESARNTTLFNTSGRFTVEKFTYISKTPTLLQASYSITLVGHKPFFPPPRSP